MLSNLLDKIVKNNSQFLKYAFGGAVAFVVDVSLLYILTDVAGLWYLWSATFSFTVAAFVNYLFQRFWTFKSQERRVVRQFLTFLSLQLVGLFINNSMMYLTVEYLGVWYLVAKAFAALVVLIWNFWSSKVFVFNRQFIDSPPKIILAAEIFPPDIGGPATYTQRLAEYLSQRGYPLKVICYASLKKHKPRNKNNSSWLIKIDRQRPVLIKYFLYFIKLINISLGVDVIYAQGPIASALPALLASKILRKRLVVKVVGDYCWEQAQLIGATKKNIDDWQEVKEFSHPRNLINLKLRLLCWLQKLTVNNAYRVIVPSYYLKKIVSGWGVRPQRIEVVYNSAEFKQPPQLSSAEAKKEIDLQGDIIITGGRFTPWKGFDMLINIMPQLKKINPNFKLVIFGSGPQVNYLKQLVQKQHLTQDVILTGQLAHSELYKYFYAASIFVLNSGYEGLSHTILDAMYYHLPIIVSDKGGNSELIQDDYNGLVVPYNHKAAWITAIQRIWQDKKLRQRLSSNSLIKLEIFQFEYMAKATLSVLLSKP